MLENYEEVPDRIRRFFQDHPGGRLTRGDWCVKEVKDQTFIVYSAAAYRSPDDSEPGIGTAWEPFPGKTNFTRDSELMNAETSAWGRALVALGYVAKSVASSEEVRNRTAAPAWAAEASPDRKRLALDALTDLLGGGEQDRQVAKYSLAAVKESLGVVPDGVAVALSRIARVVQESRETTGPDGGQ